MSGFWIIAPYESNPPDLFDKVWEFDLANNLISIGWAALGDVSKMSRKELAQAVASTFPEKPAGTKGLLANMIWAFYHEICPGDLVIARRGRKTLAAVGKVAQPAVYLPGRNPHVNHPNFLGITWQEQPRDRIFPSIVFPMHTLQSISGEEFRRFVEGPVVATEAPGEVEDPGEFVLERYLEDFIVSNFQTIFKGSLQIYRDSEGNEGQQYNTDEVGSIDILAIEPKSNSFVVIELKKGRSSDKVVGQVLRYMGWVKKTLCVEGQAVKGLIICRDPDPKLSYALQMTKDIDIRYYAISFKLTDTPIT